jgi:hypothetical protein
MARDYEADRTDVTPSWLRDDEAERRPERAWQGERWESDRGRDRDHEARKRGHGGDTGHDTSWSGPSSGTWHQGGPFAGRGPKGYQRSDGRIREDVSDRLTDAPDIDASEIEVSVSNGEVTLAGTVRSRQEKRRTEDVTERVTGVRDVHNALRISPGQEASRREPK